VVVTGHQAFYTREAMCEIARVTLANADALDAGGACGNRVLPVSVAAP
jgi:lactate dehydrogenase-like 2-hydroxyacid dehydrogenase